MSKPSLSLRSLVLSAVVAALYAALTLLFAPISYGPVQFRIAEALTLLPALFPQAIPGLTLGCLLANLLGSATPWDVIFGTLATLLAAVLARRLRRRLWVAAATPVLCNAIIIGVVLHFTLADALLLPTIASVGLGEAAVVYALGIPFTLALARVPLLRESVGMETSALPLKKNRSTNVSSSEMSQEHMSDEPRERT